MSKAMFAIAPTSLRPLASRPTRRDGSAAVEMDPGEYAHSAASRKAEILDRGAGRSPDENVTCG